MFTIKEIAERAGVSRTTVSRVLNASGYVSEDVRRRVQQVIEETGYVPSAHAKSLRTKRTKVVGAILPKISTETSSRLVKGMDEVLAKEGYQILLANTNLDPEKEIEYLRLLKSRNADGVVLSATNMNERLLGEITNLNLPFVMVGDSAPGFASVVLDDYEAAKDVVNCLVEKGYTKIAFIGVDEKDRSVGYWRRKGFLDAMQENGLQVEKGWMQQGVFDVESGAGCMKSILEQSTVQPRAIVAVTDRLAIGAMQHAKEIGLSVPGDLAVAGMGASELSCFVSPPLTTIDFSIEEAGRAAASLILERISGLGDVETIKTIKHRLLERDSI